MVYIWHTYPLLEPYCPLVILSEIRCLTYFHQLLDLLDLNILKLTFPYLLFEGRFHLYGNSLSVSNEPKIEFLKFPTQFLRHLANSYCIHVTLATQSISNHISFPWMVVYLQVVIFYEL